MPDNKSRERQEADAAFDRATSQSREAPTEEAQPVSDKTSKLKELRLERDADARKRMPGVEGLAQARREGRIMAKLTMDDVNHGTDIAGANATAVQRLAERATDLVADGGLSEAQANAWTKAALHGFAEGMAASRRGAEGKGS
jgi:hypothetical protein